MERGNYGRGRGRDGGGGRGRFGGGDRDQQQQHQYYQQQSQYHQHNQGGGGRGGRDQQQHRHYQQQGQYHQYNQGGGGRGTGGRGGAGESSPGGAGGRGAWGSGPRAWRPATPSAPAQPDRAPETPSAEMVSMAFIWGKNKRWPAVGEDAIAPKEGKAALDPSPAREGESSRLSRRKKTSQPSRQPIGVLNFPSYCPNHVPNWGVKESDLSRNTQVARRMIHHFATLADRQVLAEHSSEAVEATLCTHLAQVVTLVSDFSRRFTQASKKTLELDTQLHERDEIIESQRKDLEELTSERQLLGQRIQELEEELSWVNSFNRRYERKYAEPTKLPEVEEFIQHNLQEAWRKGFQAHATEVLRAHPNLDMSNVRSIEEIVAELEEDLEMADDEDASSDP